MSLEILIGIVAGAVLGIGGFVAIRQIAAKKKRDEAKKEAEKILQRAKSEAARIEKDSKNRARDFEQRARKNAEQEIEKQKSRLAQQEKQYKEKEQQLEKNYRKKEAELQTKERSLKELSEKVSVAEGRVREMERAVQEKLNELSEKLGSIAQYSKEQAKSELVNAMEQEAKAEAAQRIILLEDEAKAEAERRAKRIISMAISRYAGEYASERVVSVVALPSDEMKGKIIGREGRNIRTIESLCGVDLIIDDTPEAVVISGFDPVRREVAKRALERLMTDGRIHPARIEEVIEKTKKELFKSIKEDGEKALLDLGIHGVNAEITKVLGSLRYRTSYTQNNYTHSIEVGFLAGLMATELGGDVKAARRAGLFHDLGKALDHSVEGSHAVIGAEFAKRYGEREDICHAIRAHHEDEKPRTMLAYLVQAADALSSARPGARRSMMETYVQRLTDLESIGNSFDGVERTFAIQAGREIRVIVDASKVTDEQALMLSRDVARKIERELNYPGQIKVSVVRETRAVEHAR
jgi:ribonuclease Y